MQRGGQRQRRGRAAKPASAVVIIYDLPLRPSGMIDGSRVGMAPPPSW